MGNILGEIGLSEREIKAYRGLLKLGVSKASSIQKESKLPSSKIGETLNKLVKKELIEEIIVNGKKQYKAKDPDVLLDRYDQKRIKVEQVIKKFNEINKNEINKDCCEIFFGFKAIRELFLILLKDAKEGEEYMGFSSGETVINEDILKLYTFIGRLREEKGVKNMQLFTHKRKVKQKIKKSYEKVIKDHSDIKKTKSYKYKEMVRYCDVTLPGDTVIFKNKVVILNLNSSNIILLHSKNIVDDYRKFFMSIWRNAKAL